MGWNSSLCNHVQTVRIEWFTGFFEIWWFIIYTESAGWQNLIQFRSNSFFTICSCPPCQEIPQNLILPVCTYVQQCTLYMYIFLNQKKCPLSLKRSSFSTKDKIGHSCWRQWKDLNLPVLLHWGLRSCCFTGSSSSLMVSVVQWCQLILWVSKMPNRLLRKELIYSQSGHVKVKWRLCKGRVQ